MTLNWYLRKNINANIFSLLVNWRWCSVWSCFLIFHLELFFVTALWLMAKTILQLFLMESHEGGWSWVFVLKCQEFAFLNIFPFIFLFLRHEFTQRPGLSIVVKQSNGREVSADGSEERELEKDEWCEARSWWWRKKGGWIEGLQQWVAEQHESDCGPQLGQSWGSLLITTRIRPRLLTGLDSALLVQTSSPFFTCLFVLACQQTKSF